jgi:hypothetical protein
MDKINSGSLELPSYDTSPGGISVVAPVVSTSSNVNNSSVYNNSYSINVSANGTSDTEAIARAVINKIKQYDNQAIRGVRV